MIFINKVDVVDIQYYIFCDSNAEWLHNWEL